MTATGSDRKFKVALSGLTIGIVAFASSLPISAQQGSSVRFQTLNPPYGDFIISVPPGWGFKGNAYENPITVTAPNAGGPSVTIWAAIWVTGLAEDLIAPEIVASAQRTLNACNQMAEVMRIHTTKWSPSDSLRLFASYLGKNGTPAQITSQKPFGSQSVDATMRVVEGGIPLDAHLSVSMMWVPSPSYSTIVQMAAQKCPGRIPVLAAWESFAFLTSCGAPAGTLPRWERVCAAILSSFYAQPNWLMAYAQQFANQMKTSAAQVNQLVGSIRRAGQEQLQGQLDYMESNWNSMRQRGAALGGDVLLKTHEGNQIYRPNMFDTWCEDSGGRVFGTNAPTTPPNCVYTLPKVGTR
jgi:hypothetical protein